MNERHENSNPLFTEAVSHASLKFRWSLSDWLAVKMQRIEQMRWKKGGMRDLSEWLGEDGKDAEHGWNKLSKRGFEFERMLHENRDDIRREEASTERIKAYTWGNGIRIGWEGRWACKEAGNENWIRLKTLRDEENSRDRTEGSHLRTRNKLRSRAKVHPGSITLLIRFYHHPLFLCSLHQHHSLWVAGSDFSFLLLLV